MTSADQLPLFEPEGEHALALMQAHAKRFERFVGEAELWDACLCPGARDQANELAAREFEQWLTFAILLDIEREAS